MGISAEIDLAALTDFHQCLEKAPRTLFRELAKAFAGIGRYDIQRIRENVTGTLKLKSKGAANSFKARGSDVSRAADFSKLFVSEYTGWKAADIFQTGGTIAGKGGKNLTIIEPGGRNASGKRKYTQAQIRNMILNKQARFVPTPRGWLIVMSTGGLTKRGIRSGTRDTVIAILRKSVTEKKRIDFYETAEGGTSVHQELMEYAIENTLVEIAISEKQGA